jgi:hypothetical protein
MKPRIKNLDSLEKEILRLQLEARSKADKLEKNFDHFRENYASMTMNMIFNRSCRKEAGKEKLKEKLFNSIWGNEKVHNGIDRICGHLADKAAGGIESLLNKILHGKDA